jgi:hypothetical protein
VVLQFGLAELLEHQLLLCRAGSFCCNNYHWCWKCQSTYLDFCPAEFDPTIYMLELMTVLSILVLWRVFLQQTIYCLNVLFITGDELAQCYTLACAFCWLSNGANSMDLKRWSKTLAAFIFNPCLKNIPWAYIGQDRVDCLALL